MTDVFTKQERSRIMSRIRGKNTSIEVAFRKAAYGAGVRGYRIGDKVPGSPDMYFPKRHLAVFIDGCFWHRCPKCFRMPKSNLGYWRKKIRDNEARDKRVDCALKMARIRYIHIWEHDVRKRPDIAVRRLLKRLDSPN